MKKNLCVLLALCLLTAFTAACNKDEIQTPEAPGEPEEEVFDFYGGTAVFLTSWPEEYKYDAGYSATGDKMLARYDELKSNNNCILDIVYCATGDVPTYMLTAATSGKSVPDFVDASADTAYSLYGAGLLLSLNEIPTINPSDTKWGPEAFRIYGNFAGEDYGFYPYDWEFIPQFAGIVLSNTALITALGMTSPHEYLENGSWNWDNFYSELEKGTVTDGDIKYTGLLCSSDDQLAKAAVFSNGSGLVLLNNGSYVSGLTDSKTTDALTYAASLYSAGFVRSGGTNEQFTTTEITYPYYFCESWVGTVYSGGDVSSVLPSFALDDYGFHSFPYGTSGNAQTMSGYVHAGRRLNWFSGVSDNLPEEIGTIADILFAPLPNSTPEGWKQMAEDLIFHHESDYENFVYMTEHCNYDYSAQLSAVSSKLNSALSAAVNGKSTVSAALEAVASSYADEIKEKLN